MLKKGLAAVGCAGMVLLGMIACDAFDVANKSTDNAAPLLGTCNSASGKKGDLIQLYDLSKKEWVQRCIAIDATTRCGLIEDIAS